TTQPHATAAPHFAITRRGIGEWLTTPDHKKIGIMYMVSTFIFFLIGGLAALLVRWQLALPEAPPFNGELYNQIFNIHASVMNFLVTILNMRTPGMTMHRMPLFVWAILTTSFIQLVATPALAAALLMVLADRHLGTHFFDPNGGGDVIGYQHGFWFYSHPAVYIMILPYFGVISEVLQVFSHKPVFGYKAEAYSTAAIGVLGFLVWAHHMFTVGLPVISQSFFILMTMLIAIPTGIKIFNWAGTLWGGHLQFKAPLLFALGFLTMFVIGGISGVWAAVVPVDYLLPDTYLVVAHSHYDLFGCRV